MNGLASLLRYQMGGPVGYVTGGQIDSIYRSLFNRPADEGGKAYYEALLKDRSVADAIAIIGGGATGEDVNEVSPIEIAGKAIAAAYSDTLSRSVDEIDPEGLTYYLGQVLYEGLDPTRIDDIFADSPEAQQFEAKLPGITDILKKDAAGGSYSVYTPPPVVTPPAVTDDTGAGAGAGAGTGVVTGDTGAGAGAGAGAGDEVNYPYFDDPNADPGRKQITVLDEAGNIVSGPPDKVIPGIPTFARQTPSNLTFAPLRRGLAQLRPAMSMTGLTSGQAAFGGVAPTPGQSPPDLITAQDRAKELIDRTYRTVLNRNPTQAGYNFYLPKILSGELNTNNIIPTLIDGATSGPDKEVAANYAIQNPSAAQPFTLQTGAYGAPTPTFLARPEKAAEPFPTDPKPLTDFTQNPILGNLEDGTPVYSPNPAPQESSARAGGMIKMAEGGEPTAPPTPPKMTELFPSDLGSAFNSSEFVDDKGRLVGGYSKPIYEDNVLVDYEFVPYKDMSNVVFGRELREREAMGVSPEEQEMALRAMIARQGLTGVNPMTGGLPGIMPREAVMRRRPDYNFAEGGIASVAQNLADKGRKGDSMLVHMTPDEVAGLQALAQQMGGSLTINPQTGLPEANIFKKLLPMALGFALGPAGAGLFQSALSAGLAVGAGYTLATGSLQQGLSAGLSAYGGSNLGTGLQAAGAEAATSAAASEAAGTAATDVAATAGGAAAEAAMVNPMAHPDFGGSIVTGGPSQAFAFDPMTGDQIITGTGGPLPGPEIITPTPSGGVYGKSSMPIVNNMTDRLAPTTPGSALTGAERSLLGDKATRDLAAERYAAETGSTLGTSAMQIAGGAAGQSVAEEQKAIKAQQAAIDAKEDERKRRFDALFARTLGTMPARSGGLMKLAGGGMSYMEAGGTTGPTGAPRDVTGTGDGMSDSVPASIEGVQEARLADGEFVIPADVVADIGNGSSDAGSKKLYDMMDRIRKARHGTTEQPPEIQAERLMPA
jgi:hypothetical protein